MNLCELDIIYNNSFKTGDIHSTIGTAVVQWRYSSLTTRDEMSKEVMDVLVKQALCNCSLSFCLFGAYYKLYFTQNLGSVFICLGSAFRAYYYNAQVMGWKLVVKSSG